MYNYSGYSGCFTKTDVPYYTIVLTRTPVYPNNQFIYEPDFFAELPPEKRQKLDMMLRSLPRSYDEIVQPVHTDIILPPLSNNNTPPLKTLTSERKTLRSELMSLESALKQQQSELKALNGALPEVSDTTDRDRDAVIKVKADIRATAIAI